MSRLARGRPALAARPAPDRETTLLDRVLFVALLALLATRLLIAETFDSIDLPFLTGGAPQIGPTRATTIWLDSLTLLTSALALRGVHPWSRQNSLVSFAVAALLAAVILSTAAAPDRRAAASAGGNLVVLAVAGCGLSRVARTIEMRRLAIAVALACAAANAAKCWMQRSYEFADVADYWETTQRPALEQSGADLTDPAIENFKRRMLSGNAYGLLAHPNVAASLLAVAAVFLISQLAAAVRSASRERAAAVALAVALALLVVSAMSLTGSKGAIVALCGGIAIGGWLVLRGGARAARPTLLATGLLCAYFLLTAALACYGLFRGTLPGASLAFRWEYWVAGLAGYLDSPWFGAGRQNFIFAYLQHKSATATEEVRDAHNLWVTLLVELGPLGVAVGTAMLAALVARAAHGIAAATTGWIESATISGKRLAAIVAAAVLVSERAFSGAPLGDVNIMLLWVFEFALVWCVAFAASLHVLRELPATGLLCGSLAGLLCLFIHNLVDFSLMTPVGLSLAAFLAATGAPAIAVTPGQPRGAAARFALPALALAGWFVHAGLVLAPTIRADAAEHRLRSVLERRAAPRAGETFENLTEQLARADSWDARGPRLAALAWSNYAREPGIAPEVADRRLATAAANALLACGRNPRSTQAWRALARIQQQLAEAAQGRLAPEVTAQRRKDAADSWRRVVTLYPTSPVDRIGAVDALVQYWRGSDADDAAREAREHLDAALAIDATRPADAAVKLNGKMRERIEKLREALEGRTTTTEPSSAAP